MISRLIDKLTQLRFWQLVLVAIVASELLTLFFSAFFSVLFWGHLPFAVLLIGIIDAFVVALIIVFLTILVVRRIRVSEIINKQLREEIEERKRAEAEKEKLEKQLRQVMKMEAIGTLAGGIAHDFNNILTAIVGYTELAKAQLPANAEVSHNLEQVLIASQRAVDLVGQILTFSRQGEETLKPLHVQTLLKEVVKLLRSSLPTTISLTENITAGCGMILADPTQIHQVLMNICTNAKHAIGDEAGTLAVSLVEIQAVKVPDIDGCLEKMVPTYLDLEISDTGCGMDGLTMAKIFDPFFTTKEVGKGTGIGLAVVHGIVKQHGGVVTVASDLGQGTTFNVYLPVISEVSPVCELGAPENIPRGKGQRILFVDDEVALTQMMQLILTNLGYRVTAFTSSFEAFAAYQKNPDGFDMIITDMTMPEMTGVELSQKVFKLRPDVPIILCTGFSETINASQAQDLGIAQFLQKPFEQLRLAKAVRDVLS